MDLMARRAGASSSSTRRNRADRAASRVPAATPSRKPAVMRTREYPMATPKKSSVGNQFRQPRKHSERGDQDDALINGHGTRLPQEQPEEYSPGPYGSAAFHGSQRLK